jgi:hypothetical protein
MWCIGGNVPKAGGVWVVSVHIMGWDMVDTCVGVRVMSGYMGVNGG